MDPVASGFWGAYFGTVSLMLAAALVAFARSMHRVALTAALSALASAFFVIAYLGWLPIDDPDTLDRVLAHVACVTSTFLGLMLLAMLGVLRRRHVALRFVLALAGASVAVLALGWFTSAHTALALSSTMACAIGIAGFAIALRSAFRGDRLAWVAVAGVSFMLLAVATLSWIALERGAVSWTMHAISAAAATAYLATMASVLWSRYSYLIELRQVMGYGPSYDPITRMRSHAETGQMVGAAFHRDESSTRPVGVLVVSIGNFYALEKLHGRAAVNHALFVCASRLRRSVPRDVEMGRLSDDGFLLLLKNSDDHQRLIQIARIVAEYLSRPVELGTSRELSALENNQTRWVADIGIGLLAASTAHIRAASAVAMARAMSRTAWSYTSRIAWFDQAANQIAELPQAEAL